MASRHDVTSRLEHIRHIAIVTYVSILIFLPYRAFKKMVDKFISVLLDAAWQPENIDGEN